MPSGRLLARFARQRAGERVLASQRIEQTQGIQTVGIKDGNIGAEAQADSGPQLGRRSKAAAGHRQTGPRPAWRGLQAGLPVGPK